jgi:hypothetical protein
MIKAGVLSDRKCRIEILADSTFASEARRITLLCYFFCVFRGISAIRGASCGLFLAAIQVIAQRFGDRLLVIGHLRSVFKLACFEITE